MRPLAAGVLAAGLSGPAAADGPRLDARDGRNQTQAAAPAKPVLMRVPGIRQPFSQADVDFMQGMIPHHAQAVVMAGWCPTRAAGREVKLLCERIVVSQKDEIKLMQTWLADRGQEVPAADATHHKMKHGDTVHEMLMPGMLNDEELKQLEQARGAEFDRLFLTFMIRHHEGALNMVKELFASYGAAQDDAMYTFASDVEADQEIEIVKMRQMLAAIKGDIR
jgi:uncharacterized protein (DUF305 family)